MIYRKSEKETIEEKLIPTGLESKIKIEFYPINHKHNFSKREYFKVTTAGIAINNFNIIHPKELIVNGFEKSSIDDYGAYNRGYSFFTNHPKYGKIEIARGTETNKNFECNKFEKLIFLGTNFFYLLDYEDEPVLQRDIENYFNFLKEEVKKFTTSFNKVVQYKMGKSTLNSTKILSDLKSKYNLS